MDGLLVQLGSLPGPTFTDRFQARYLPSLSLSFPNYKPVLTCVSHCPARGENRFLEGGKKKPPFLRKAQIRIQHIYTQRICDIKSHRESNEDKRLLRRVLWVALHPSERCIEVLTLPTPLVPVNMTLFGNRFFGDIRKLR